MTDKIRIAPCLWFDKSSVAIDDEGIVKGL